MSQNTNTLLLFFDHEDSHKTCLLMFLKLNQGDFAQAQLYANQFKMNLPRQWGDTWFNQAVTANPDFIRLDYDSSTSEDLPLEMLHSLFKAGMKGSAIEVFHDQVGEYSRAHFVSGSMVNPKSLFKRVERSTSIIESEFVATPDQLADTPLEKPISIRRLLQQQQQQEAEAKEMVGLMREVGKTLFKGLWLWVGLTVLLLIGLPLLYTSQVITELDSELEIEDDLHEVGNVD